MVSSFLDKEGLNEDNKLFFKNFKLIYSVKDKTRFLKDGTIDFLNIVLLINSTLIIS